jgi:hypothetical protein
LGLAKDNNICLTYVILKSSEAWSIMQYTAKLEFLEEQIKTAISTMKTKADRNKRRAAFVNVGSVLFGAGVTIFLGLQIEGVETLFKNIALIFGVLVTVVSGINAFFNYRSLWVKQKVTLLQLYSLRNEIEFYKAGLDEDDTISERRVSAFFKSYQQIWDVSAEEWLRMRSESQQQDEDKNEA